VQLLVLWRLPWFCDNDCFDALPDRFVPGQFFRERNLGPTLQEALIPRGVLKAHQGSGLNTINGQLFGMLASAPLQEVFPATQTREKSSKHYPALDGLRGIAILAVFFSHFGGGHKSTNLVIRIWSHVADAGWIGVDLFFVLSGFLITGILLDTAHQENRAKNFYARRALRIFPLFYGVLCGFLLLTPVLHLQWRAGHLLYFFYLSNMIPVLAPGLRSPGTSVGLVHLWSLAVEEQFYLLWPFAVWFIKDRKKLLRICLAIMAFALVLRIILVMRGVDPFIVYSLLFTRADSLICGSALAILVRDPSQRQLPIKWVLPLTGASTLGLFLLSHSGSHEAPLISTLGYTLIALFCACLVYGAQQGKGWIAAISNHRWLRFFGRYSYGLYIYHGLLVVFLFPLVYPIQQLVHSVLWGSILYLLFSLGLTLAIAMTSYHLVEAPILKLKKRFS
jgi:peptidoglycan/LPS O-acetylase OafA/YrhL